MAAAPQERMSLLRLTTTVTATSNIAHEATSALRLVEVETFRAKSAAAAASNLVGAAIASAAVAGSSSTTASAAVTTLDPMRMFTGPCANHSAYVRDGMLFVWGANESGQLGLGDTTRRFAPTRVLGIWDAVAVGCGADFTVVLRSNGTAFAMGANANGQLGNGTITSRLMPTSVIGVTGATAIAVGAAHVLFLNGATGNVTGYGSDSNGQLGDGSTGTVTIALTTMTLPVDTSARVIAVAAGARHSFIVLGDGTAYGFGDNTNGQLGLGDTTQRTTPAKVPDLGDVVGAACGQRHTLLIRSEGQVLAAGDNAAGQLGRGAKSTTPAMSFAEALAAPMISTTGSNMRAAAGDVHSVVVRADGSVWAFGDNASGQLGTATMVLEHLSATRVAALYGTIIGVSSGATHTVLLRSQDLAQPYIARVFASGLNSNGQVGDIQHDEQRRTLLMTNGGNSRRFFVPVPEAQTRKRVYSNGSNNNMSSYVDANGVVYAWGSSTYPTPVSSLNDIVMCSSGIGFRVAVDASGNVYSWGQNNVGQLGVGVAVSSSQAPINVSAHGTLSGRSVVMVAAGQSHVLALDSTGAVHAWGDNSTSQVGDGTTIQRSVPVLITGGTLAGRSIVAIVAGQNHSMALDSTGVIHAWGSNGSSQLGDNTVTTRSLPITVLSTGSSSLNGRAVVAIAAGAVSSFALDATGALHLWGNDGISTRAVPAQLATSSENSLAGRPVMAVASGTSHNVAVDAMGVAHCWGSNSSGQLGNGSATTNTLPKIPLLSGTTVVRVSAGANHTIAVDSFGSVWAWGAGPLGNRSHLFAPTAIPLSSRDLHAPMFSVGGIGDHKLLMNRNTSNAALVQFVGANTYGQLGDGSTTFRTVIGSLPQFPADVVSAATGLHHSAIVLADGSAYIWGRNHMGQCGQSNTGGNLIRPVSGVPTSVQSVCCGTHCTFLRLDNGLLAALGDNTSNQLGLGSNVVAASNPTVILGLSNVSDVASGGGVTLAVNGAGRLFSWGTNEFGNTGRGTTAGVTTTPTNVDIGGLRVRRVAVGDGISAAITEDGGLYTCGLNFEGALGLSNNFRTAVPIPSFTRNEVRNAVDVACGPRHMVVQVADNTLRIFGRNHNAQRGVPGDDDWRPFAAGTESAQRIATTQNFVLLERFDRSTKAIGQTVGARSATVMSGGGNGSTHSGLITPTGELHMWGGNNNGQLGNGTTSNLNVPINLSASGALQGKQIIAVTQGNSYTVALDATGSLFSWGINSVGQLGDGSTTRALTPVPVSTTQGSSSLWSRKVVAITSGGDHTVAVDADGAVHAWGKGTNGQLGTGTKTNAILPTLVSRGSLTGKKVVAVAAGDAFTLAIDTTGVVHAWGNNGSGQLGIASAGTELLLPMPVEFSPSRTIVAIACGSSHALALDSTGVVLAWGANGSNQTGNGMAMYGGTFTTVTLPIVVSSVSSVIHISASGSSCIALTSFGSLLVWGANGQGILGITQSANQPTPIGMASGSLSGRRAVSVGMCGTHCIAMDSYGNVHTWGAGTAGQLGTGLNVDSFTPALTVGLRGSLVNTNLVPATIRSGASKLIQGGFGFLGGVITPYGTLHLWGRAPSSTSIWRVSPTIFMTNSLNGRTVVEVSSGTEHVLVLDSFGAVHAWGAGLLGRVGDGRSQTTSDPVFVSTSVGTSSLAGKIVTSVRAGDSHSLVIDSLGAIHAWGANTNGALGDGTSSSRATPVAVTGLTGHVINAVAAGEHTSYAVTSLGALYAWGTNTNSMLGNGTTTHQSTPVLITSGTLASKTLVAIAACSTHVLVLDSENGLHSWGTNAMGQLGDGTTTARSVPVRVSIAQGSSSLNGRQVVAIAVGTNFSMALDSVGAVHTWGTGERTSHMTTTSFPKLVSGLSGRTIVGIASVGSSAAAVIDSSGTILTWGVNSDAQMGDGANVNSPFYVPSSVVNARGSLVGTSLASVDNQAPFFTPFFVNFTGQHRVFMAAGTDPASKEDGFIVVCDQNEYMAADGTGGLVRGRRAIKINEALPVVSISRKAFDRRVFGVLSGVIQPLSSTESAQLAEQTYERLREVGDTRVQINSVGEGAIWVSDMGLEAGSSMLSGDLVTSSDLPGYGMAQSDGQVRSYTVAKLTCDCDFTASLEVVREPRRDHETGMPIIDPVTGNPMWEDVTREAFFDGDQEVDGEALVMLTEEERAALRIERVLVTEPRYDLRYLDADGKRITREAYEAAKAEDPEATVYRAAFLGCTYHCG